MSFLLVVIWRNDAKDVVSRRSQAPAKGLLVGSIEHDRPHVGPFQRLAITVNNLKRSARAIHREGFHVVMCESALPCYPSGD